jgi:hypothetical protein
VSLLVPTEGRQLLEDGLEAACGGGSTAPA